MQHWWRESYRCGVRRKVQEDLNTERLQRQIYRGYVRHDVPEASDGSAWLTCPVCQSVCSAQSKAQALDWDEYADYQLIP